MPMNGGAWIVNTARWMRATTSVLDMVNVMTQDTKDRIRNLERQKIDLEARLEFVGNNLVKMHQIEQEIYEIDDTISKLTGGIKIA